MPGYEERLEALFRAVLGLPASVDVSSCQQSNTPAWDSMAHVSLVAAIEGEFGLTIDAGDSLALTSWEAARTYLESQGV
jgi:acyl carrier protein